MLSQIFKRAYFDGVIDSNPVERIERYKQKINEPKPFNKSEIKKILNALQSPYKEFFQFAFYTGLRTGELLGLRWEDVDIEKRLAHIRVNITSGKEKVPKTAGSIRTIELHCLALQACNAKQCNSIVRMLPAVLGTFSFPEVILTRMCAKRFSISTSSQRSPSNSPVRKPV